MIIKSSKLFSIFFTFLQFFLICSLHPKTTRSLEEEKCEDLTNCFSCTAKDFCMFCENTCSSRDNLTSSEIERCESDSGFKYTNEVENSAEHWFDNQLMCEIPESCGVKSTYELEEGEKIELGIESESEIEENQLCHFTIANPENFAVGINIVRMLYDNENTDRLSIRVSSTDSQQTLLTDDQLNTYKSILTLKDPLFIDIYYRIIQPSNHTDFITITFDPEQNIQINFTMIFLIFVILFFFILMYGIFSCYRCMVKRDRNQNARRIIQLYQTREWEIRDAQKRVKEIMDSLAEYEFSESIARFKQKACVICMDDFEENCKIISLGCEHIFHGRHIEKWIRQRINNPICPICKEKIVVRASGTSGEEMEEMRRMRMDIGMRENSGRRRREEQIGIHMQSAEPETHNLNYSQ